MNTRTVTWTTTLLLTLTCAAWAPAAHARSGFKLTAAVPDDVFLCAAHRHNPERKFLEEYWKEVFAALKQSGVAADAMAMLSSKLGAEQNAEVSRLKELTTRLIDGVEWDKLCGGEFVFAERMSKPVTQGSNVQMGPPDLVFLIRGADGSATKNYAGLVAILKEIVTEINKAAGEEALALDTTPRMDAPTASLKITKLSGNEPDFAPSVSLHGDVIVMAMGEKILGEVLGLLNGKSTAKPLSESPRFKKAFTDLPAAEDAMVFLDMQALLASMRSICGIVFEAVGSQTSADVRKEPLSPEAKDLDKKSIEAYRGKDYAQALTYARKAHEMSPENARLMYNVGCFSALTGHKEEALGWLEKSVDAGFTNPKHIAQDSDLDSLREDPRYQAALAKAEAQYAESVKTCPEELDLAKTIAAKVLDVPAMFDYVATVEYTDEYTTRKDTIVALVEGASEKPFYSVFGTRKPLTSFDRFLPKETVSFSINGGIDLTGLYEFILNSIREVGPKGEEILAQWAGVQQAVGFDVHTDLLGWLDGEFLSVSIDRQGTEEFVLLVKVKDEAAAREKLATALTHVSASLQALSQQNPMLAMVALRAAPTADPKLEGFHDVTVGMQPQPAVCGVSSGYLMIAQSAAAATTCLETAAGQHPSVRENSRLMGEALVPQGAFRSITFSDKRSLGDDISQILGAVGMMGGMAMMAVPDPDAQQILNKVLQMVMKLGPVAQKIDFYKSSAGYATFDGKAWHSRTATNYQSPAERVAQRGE